MKLGSSWLSSLGLSLVLLFLFPCIEALRLAPRNAAPAVISLDIQRRSIENPVKRDRVRRQEKTVQEGLDNEQTLYFCNLTLGTPEQKLRLHIDTGSSDLWVNSAQSALCTQPSDPCSESGTYDIQASSTSGFVSSDFNITYMDGSSALGDYVTDTLGIGGQQLKDFQFGIGESSSSAQGVLGIGYPMNEVQVSRNFGEPYPNLPSAMKNAGLIRSTAYSLWLNDLDANTGSILFGGVNTGKFSGNLFSLPVQRVNGAHSALIVTLTGFSMNVGSQGEPFDSRTLPTPVLLDSGSSLTYLPDGIVATIFDELGVTFNGRQGIGYVPCNLPIDKGSGFNFTFSGPSIFVGLDEMIISAGSDSSGSQPQFSDGEPACIFGIAPSSSSISVLGDTFLRSAYVVFDLENNEISIAKTNFNSTEDNIVEITEGKDGVPDATGVLNPVTSVTAPTGGAHLDATGTGVITGAPNSATVSMETPNWLVYSALMLGVLAVI
ncbi:hypothetical protein FQN54_001896 [Arachnomyces sp. PD_36]|nr:hypothetical protein FQN54_001896 [Arachnomyces sp. PD_36]